MVEIFKSALKNGVIVTDSSFNNSETEAIVAVSELSNYGYIVHPNLLMHVDLEQLIVAAYQLSGSNRKYVPMYQNFPRAVKEMSDIEILVDQIVHYLSAGTLVPNIPLERREELKLSETLRTAVKLEKTSPVSDYVSSRVQALVSKKQGMSTSEFEELKNLWDNWTNEDKLDVFVNAIVSSTHGENSALAIKVIVSLIDKNRALEIINSADNADHLLRYVIGIYGYKNDRSSRDYSLAVDKLNTDHATAVNFLSMPNDVRRAIISKLASFVSDRNEFGVDKIFAKKDLWKRVMRSIHPYSLNGGLSDKQRRIVDIIHEKIDYITYNGALEGAFSSEDFARALKLLELNSGALLRRINQLITLNPKKLRAINTKINKIDHVRLSTAISAYNGVLAYNELSVHGENNVVVENSREVVDVKTTVNALKRLIERSVAQLDVSHIKTVNIADGNFPMPLIVRDASSSNKTVYRGEIIAHFEDTDTLRTFIHWRNGGNGRVDLDASMLLLDESLEHVGHIGWNSYDRDLGTYSGDLTNAPGKKGAAEFIDLDVKDMNENNVKFALFSVNSYSGQSFNTLDHIAGVMLRGDSAKGEIFDPRTVVNSFSSVSQSREIIPLLINFEEKNVVWVDSATSINDSYSSSYMNKEEVIKLVRAQTGDKFSVEDFARMVAKVHKLSVDKNAKVDVETLTALLD